MKWYENKELIHISECCDNATDANDKDALLSLVTQCEQHANADGTNPLITARYLYCALTSLQAIAKLSSNEKESEHYIEKAIFFARKAIATYELELANHSFEDAEYLQTLSSYTQLIINYSNLLHFVGRILESTSILSRPLLLKNPLVNGVLGIIYLDMTRFHYDNTHNEIITFKAYSLLMYSLSKKNDFFNDEQLKNFQSYKEYIEKNCLNSKLLQSSFSMKNFIKPFPKMVKQEMAYRNWIAKNTLALNILNDIDHSVEVGYDPLHLPTILDDTIKTSKVPVLQGLFNQIKQEYVSARFLLYEGMGENEQHFSDKNVTLINTLDYSIHSLGLEKIKFGFRACYSILDSIANFLNVYFDMGLDPKKLNYYKIWNSNNKSESKLLQISRRNYPLHGMWWLFKDIRSSYVGEYQPNTEKFKNIIETRNAIEHRCLKIVRFNIDINVKQEMTHDNNTYSLPLEVFIPLTLELFKFVRETIIMLILAIQCNELSKDQDKFRVPILSYEYLDSEKIIF